MCSTQWPATTDAVQSLIKNRQELRETFDDRKEDSSVESLKRLSQRSRDGEVGGEIETEIWGNRYLRRRGQETV